MKSLWILVIFLFNRCLIGCLPIEYSNQISDESEIDDLTATTVKSTRKYASVSMDYFQGNASQMTLPDDVEWVKSTAANQQQIAIPVGGSIIELILAVSHFTKCFCPQKSINFI